MKRSHIPLFLALLLALLLAQSTHLSAADPAWWAARGVTTAASPSNKSPATIGQAKHVVAMALKELQTRIDTPTFLALQADVAAMVNLSVPTSAAQIGEQKNILLVGQLKAIADPFYRQLNVIAPLWLRNQRVANGTQDLTAPNHIFPWSSSTSDDSNKAMASIGQLKAVFALRFEMDSDANSLPDFWEYRFLGQLGNNETADTDNDGLSNLQEGQAGTDPLSIDTDQDGMPDAWERLYHLNPIDPLDAVLDLDADGMTALEEFLAGTNPESANTSSPGAAKESFVYDQADRLTGVVAPAPATLSLDPEGNLLNLQ